MKKKVLFVVTSHGIKGHTGKPTGYYLSEVSHPWKVLRKGRYEIDFVSPQGGKPPVDGLDLSDRVNKEFWEDKNYKIKAKNTMKPSEVDPNDYIAIFYAGGHGTMWDFPDNEGLAEIGRTIYENGGIVSAVCHGPSGFVNLKLNNGKYLVDGKRVNSFTNEEEIATNLDKVVPFLLESKLIQRGAKFEKSGPGKPHIAIDDRLITGQNPASARGVGEALLEELHKLELTHQQQPQEQQENRWH
jgi:putative intracellular protease/amidase